MSGIHDPDVIAHLKYPVTSRKLSYTDARRDLDERLTKTRIPNTELQDRFDGNTCYRCLIRKPKETL